MKHIYTAVLLSLFSIVGYGQNTSDLIICLGDLEINCPRHQSNICADSSIDPAFLGKPTITQRNTDCPIPVIEYRDFVMRDNPCNEKLIARRWFARYEALPDEYDDFETCVQVIGLRYDDNAPIIENCPSNITAANNCNPVSWVPPTIGTSCGIESFTSNYNPGHSFAVGSTNVVYTGKDKCGRTSVCEFSVIVQNGCCNEQPNITCPSDVSICIEADKSPTSVGYPSTSSNSIYCPAITVSHSDQTLTNNSGCALNDTIIRTWVAKYSDTNLASCVQNIIIEDNDAPVVVFCPQNIVIENNGSIANWTTPSFNDGCGIKSITSNYNSGDQFPEGETIVTYVAEDACDREVSCTFSVSIRNTCTNSPIITCPERFVGCPATETNPETAGKATASIDGYCDSLNINYTDNILSSGPCDGTISINRIWKATESTTNKFSTCLQRIRIRDNQDPKIKKCPANMTINDTEQALWKEPIITDNCSIRSVISSHNNSTNFPAGETTVTYTARDICDNIATCSFKVFVNETCQTNPVIICPEDITVCPEINDPIVTGYASASIASQACDTPTVTYSDSFLNNATCGVEIQRTWKAQSSGRESSCVQIITHDDRVNPVISNCPDDRVATDQNNQISWTSPTANDNCGIQIFNSNFDPGSTFPLGITTVSYVAIDRCGNQSTCIFTVTINPSCQDDLTITCPYTFVACLGGDIESGVTGYPSVTIGQNPCNSTSITHNDSQITNEECNQVWNREWRVTAGNNTKSCFQQIRLRDDDAPNISNCPSDIVLTSGSNIPNWNPPTAYDGCGIKSLTSNYASGDVFPEGQTIVTYTVEDNCGHTNSCSFTVTVNSICNTKPEIFCPSNVVVCPESSIDPQITGSASAQKGENICSVPTITYSDVVVKEEFCDKIVRRTWKASSDNLSRRCNQSIRLRDVQKPVLGSCPGNININSDNPVATWQAPSATDNCGIQSISSNFYSGQTFPIGLSKVTYIATDNCGNIRKCSFNVRVAQVETCVEKPQITCPVEFNGCINESISPSVAGEAMASPVTGCNSAMITYSDYIIRYTPCNKEIKRTWTANLENNKSSSCEQYIKLKDVINPIIVNCPNDIVISSNGTTANWSPPSANDNCKIERFTSNKKPGDHFDIGITTVVYTAKDACGMIPHVVLMLIVVRVLLVVQYLIFAHLISILVAMGIATIK